MAPQSKAEKRYLDFSHRHSDHFYISHPESPQEGFEYFASREYKEKTGQQGSLAARMFFSNGPQHFFRLLGIMFQYMAPMMRGRRECFTDLKGYFKELSQGLGLETSSGLMETYPNRDVWERLRDYGREKWQAEIGFTDLDSRLIFQGKGVLFPHTLVVIQEMDKEKIDRAPDLEAGQEVQRVYNSLGHAVNDIARWLRREYGIKCQSNHPLGGLVNTPPLAGKAGMGWQGMDGLLITPQFGKRVRIAPIFLQEKIFPYTDHADHAWIEDFCRTCQGCRKNCPAGAIKQEKKPLLPGLDGPGAVKTCIDREACYPQFTRTLGCSICIKSCPFSRGAEAYDRIKTAFLKE